MIAVMFIKNVDDTVSNNIFPKMATNVTNYNFSNVSTYSFQKYWRQMLANIIFGNDGDER